MVDTACTLSMHSQDRSRLTNIVNLKKKKKNYLYIYFCLIAIKNCNQVNHAIVLIAINLQLYY